MALSKVPEQLKALRQWVLWKYASRDGKQTKLPVTPSGTMASSTDPATWCSFDEAVAAIGQNAGVGFVFADGGGLCGIDLDGCRCPETGDIEPWAQDIIDRVASYAEVSPSHSGVKIFCRAVNPFGSGKKIQIEARSCGGKSPAIECYGSGRYFAVTGAGLDGFTDIMPADLQWLADRFLPKQKPQPRIPRTTSVDVLDRARKYIAKMDPAISGSGGHNATFKVACALILGFGLTEAEGFCLLQEWNQLCVPPWSDRELQHKIRSASKQGGERNYLRNAKESQWSNIILPEYRWPETSKAAEAESGVRMTTLRDAVEKVVANLGTERELVSTGMPDVDDAIGGGVDWGEMVVVAARPSHGKSLVALQMIHSATLAGHPSLMISEEMSDIAIGKRTIQYISDLPNTEWLQQKDDLKKQIRNHFYGRAECFIAESCKTVSQTCEQIERHVNENGVKFVVVDYAQLLTAPGRTRYEQVTNSSIEIRKITSRLGIVTIMLCQLSREIEKRNPFVPHMSDLKESGQIEQDADVVLFVVWPFKVDKNVRHDKFEFYVGKNRNRAIASHYIECQLDAERQAVRFAKPENYEMAFDRWGRS